MDPKSFDLSQGDIPSEINNISCINDDSSIHSEK